MKREKFDIEMNWFETKWKALCFKFDDWCHKYL